MKKNLRLFMMTLLCAVVSSASATTYKLEQVTSVKAGGLYVFEQAGYVMNNTINNKALQTTDSYKTTGLSGTETYVWTLETATDGFYLKNVNLTSNQYLNNTSSTTLSLGNKSSIWAFNFQNDETVLIQNKSNSNRFLGFTADSYAYKAYVTDNLSSYAHAINVYQLVETVPAPTFDPIGGTYFEPQTIYISCSDEDASIYYTTDGSDPDKNSSKYGNFIDIKTTTTIKAIAIKGSEESSVSSATYTIQNIEDLTTCESLTELLGQTDAASYLVDPLDAVVTYVYDNYAYITDESGGSILLNKSGHGLTAGQTIYGAALVDFELSNGNPQITNIDLTGCEVEDGDAPVPEEVAVSDWDYPFDTSILNRYLKVTGATITKENDKYYVQLGDDEVLLCGQGDANPIVVLVPDDTYTIIGFPTMDNDTKELLIFEQPVGTIGRTEDKPYTVAQARAAIDAGAGITGVYAKGIVSEIVTAYSSQFGNITYNISDDGETTSDQLQAYRGKSFNGNNFTSADDIKVGDVVVIYGNLTKYNTTYEFAANNQLVSLERPQTPQTPIINAEKSSIELAYDATSGEIAYTITNPVTGKALTATTDADWISNITVGDEKVTFTTTANEGTTNRTAIITLSYEGAENVTVTITQKYYIPEYATLPFEFDGSKADIENTAGLTQSGLGSDYGSSPKLKFDGTGDYLILKINERPGVLQFAIKGNTFSEGTFTVQYSTDGETYTDLNTYTELGTQTETFSNLDAEVRYIKWIYTEKVNGNVALGNIKLDKYKELPKLSFEKSEYTVKLDETFTAPTLTNPSGVTVTYSSSNEEVATVDEETGEVTIKGIGSAIITATSVPTDTYGQGSASYTIIVNDDNDDVFKLVSSNDLAEGDEIIIVNVSGSEAPYTYMGMSEDKGNNRAAVEVNYYPDGTLKGNSKLQVITLEKVEKATTSTENGTLFWRLKVKEIKDEVEVEGYLYAASSTSNHLKTETNADDDGNADATISFTDDKAVITFQGTNTRNILKYNSSSKLFACYASGQDDVKIYRKLTLSPGDVNGDGSVNVTDVMLVVRYAVNGVISPNMIFKNADFNNDGQVNVTDAMAILRESLKN